VNYGGFQYIEWTSSVVHTKQKETNIRWPVTPCPEEWRHLKLLSFQLASTPNSSNIVPYHTLVNEQKIRAESCTADPSSCGKNVIFQHPKTHITVYCFSCEENVTISLQLL